MFVDSVKIFIKSGNGGNGAVSFHREKYVPSGGPDGGDGGRGGDIVFVVDNHMRTLADYRFSQHFKAGNGDNGGGNLRKGKRGEDCVIAVPCGTVIKDAESGRVIADMYNADDRKTVMQGGYYGKGNARFRTPTRRTPTFAQNGGITKERAVILELKTIADVGLIGFPNVGKSTLLSVISNAKPKIANYHFTTLTPNLGVAEIDGYSFTVADIPGLIEGAAEGAGLGIDFLKHIERTRMLVHVIDIAGSEGRDPVDDYYKINAELKNYSEILSQRPQIVAANKSELPGSVQNAELFTMQTGIKPVVISAATVSGIKELLRTIAAELKQLPEPEPIIPDEFSFEEENPDSWDIVRDNELFVVYGPFIDRLCGRVKLADDDSFKYFQRVLREKGIIQALRDKGAHDGSAVSIGDIEFDFVD